MVCKFSFPPQVIGALADPGYAIYQAPEGSCLTGQTQAPEESYLAGAKGNTLSAAQPRRTGWTVADPSFQPTRSLTGYHFAEHTGLKMGLKLHLFTQPGCSGGKRPRVIVAMLCPSKSLTTFSRSINIIAPTLQ